MNITIDPLLDLGKNQIVIVSLDKDEKFTSIRPDTPTGSGKIQLSPYLITKYEFGQYFRLTGKCGQIRTGYLPVLLWNDQLYLESK